MNTQDENDDQRSLAQRLAVKAREIGFDRGKPVLQRCKHAQGFLLKRDRISLTTSLHATTFIRVNYNGGQKRRDQARCR